VSIESFKEALLQRYPRLFVRGPNDEAYDCGPDQLHIAGELMGDGSDLNAQGERLFDYYALDPHESTYIFGVHKEVHTLANEHGVFTEWRNTAVLGVYPI
jgi:hypothetical protein